HHPFGSVDLGHAIGNLKIEHACRALEPFAVGGALEDFAPIGALAFEHAARVMQPVGEHADLAFGSRDEPAVEPDEVGTLVEGHGHGERLPAIIFRPERFPLRPFARLATRTRTIHGTFASGRNTRYGFGRPVGTS